MAQTTEQPNTQSTTHPAPNTPLVAFFEEQTLTALGLTGASVHARIHYHETSLPKRGIDALMSKLPKISSDPVPLDLDLYCLVYDKQHTLIDQIWYGNLRNADESIRHKGDGLVGASNFDESLIAQEEIWLRPDELSAQCQRVVFVLCSYHGQPIRLANKGVAKLVDNEQNLAHSVELAALAKDAQAVILWQLVRQGDDFLVSAPLHPLAGIKKGDQQLKQISQAVAAWLGQDSTRW